MVFDWDLVILPEYFDILDNEFWPDIYYSEFSEFLFLDNELLFMDFLLESDEYS